VKERERETQNDKRSFCLSSVKIEANKRVREQWERRNKPLCYFCKQYKLTNHIYLKTNPHLFGLVVFIFILFLILFFFAFNNEKKNNTTNLLLFLRFLEENQNENQVLSL
jgi:hypothetical protein